MYPPLAELRTLEKETLRCISQLGEFGRRGALQAAASAGAASINEYKGGVDIHLGFNLDIRLRGDRRKGLVPRRVDLGALIIVAPDNKSIRQASYSLMIGKTADPATSPIVRKLHFDYEPAAFRHHGEPKPTIHMQVCGKLSPGHIAAGYSEIKLKAMYPQFEKPRIPVPPTSIALLLNWLLLEFQTDVISQPVLQSPRWRNLVVQAERTVLIPYYVAATKFLQGAANARNRFLQTHIYELTVD